MSDEAIHVDGAPTDIESEEHVETSDLSPETGKSEESSQPPKVEFSPEQQQVFNDAIGKKTFQLREMERKAQEAEQRAAELQAKLPKDARPEVPPMPDAYDDDYDGKVKQRDEALLKAAQWDAKQEFENQQRLQADHERQLKEQERVVGMAKTYNGRARELGIAPDQLQAAGQTLQQYGMSNDLAEFILTDEHGPLLTMHLASNPLAVEELRGLTPMQQAVHLANNVKPQLVAGAKRQSSAPPPADTLGQGGAPKPERGPKGATFE